MGDAVVGSDVTGDAVTGDDAPRDVDDRAVCKRPGGRSARVQQSVYEAVGALIGRGERESMTIPQIAAFAGVNATSVYRRWGTVSALVEEVATAALTSGEKLADTGNLGGDLAAWAQVIAADIARPERRAYLRALVVSRGDIVDECPCWAIRRDQAERMVSAARARGEATPGVAQILDHIIAPLYHHAVFGKAIDDDFAARLVADVMSMHSVA